MKIPALDLRQGDEITLHLTVDSVQTYGKRRDVIVSVGDARQNLNLNLEGTATVTRTGRLQRLLNLYLKGRS